MYVVWKIYVIKFYCLIVEEFIYNFCKYDLLGIEGFFNDIKNF